MQSLLNQRMTICPLKVWILLTLDLEETINFAIDNNKKAMNRYDSCDISKLNPINAPGMHHRTVSLKHSTLK